MQLYLVPQVRELAARKYGSPEPYGVAFAELDARQLGFFADEPSRLQELSDEGFEHLIADRLDRRGLEVQLCGRTHERDGGVDIIAYPRSTVVPFLIAVQVKHHRSDRKTGAPDVRDFAGALASADSPFSMGLIVTNTTFTADARWFADHHRRLLRLRDIQDLCRWLKDDFVNEYEWREIPESIELTPGVVIQIPRPKLWVPKQ